ncbi:MAG TPA: phosphoenolpyruvate carboxykinase (GTP) [Candidatus Binatia bacterium]|nr:phosphoenolpyruvate carboxykinase (GTP) [Candidatus Binatia bacterium]
MEAPTYSEWLAAAAEHCAPANVRTCRGGAEEEAELRALMLADGSLLPLDQQRHPDCYLHRSDPRDVARTEKSTFICSADEGDAGPTNNWMSPRRAADEVWPLFRNAMAGRTMYVIPYVLGPAGSPASRVGVELTDSPYVALSLLRMTRVGGAALDRIAAGEPFVKGLHSTGTLDPDKRFICHFPEARAVWSINSGYGGNALLPKKCHALRIASVQARDEDWLAEHMLIMGLTAPSGRTTWFCAAFPSACGKTNLAMLSPALKEKGYKVETLGDDIAWLRVGADGRLWAINPEAGMFGVVPGTSVRSNPNAMRMLERDVIYTNVALSADGSPWWEGIGHPPPQGLTAWDGTAWSPEQGRPAAHPNSRFTVPAGHCPTVGASFDATQGVPIDAIVFGGRRAKAAPLVYESFGWDHGVYVGATMVSETTAAATGAVGVPRNDPMAMLPFCGYDMGDYFAHWLATGRRAARAPRIFHVNWFRTGDDGKFLWPGFGENVRVLQWMIDRIEGAAEGVATPIGIVPAKEGLDLTGLSLGEGALDALLAVDAAEWTAEAERNGAFLAKFRERMPAALTQQHYSLLARLAAASDPKKPHG